MADKHWKYIANGLNILILYLGLLGRLPHTLKLLSLRAGYQELSLHANLTASNFLPSSGY